MSHSDNLLCNSSINKHDLNLDKCCGATFRYAVERWEAINFNIFIENDVFTLFSFHA